VGRLPRRGRLVVIMTRRLTRAKTQRATLPTLLAA
jgi:hypothetical protein